jgi:hypothetical protein
MFALYQAIRAIFAHAKNRESTPSHKIFARFERSLRGFSDQIDDICSPDIRLTNPDASRTLRLALQELIRDLSRLNARGAPGELPPEFEAILDPPIEGDYFRVHGRPQARTLTASDSTLCSFQPMEAANGLLTTRMTVSRGPAKGSYILCHSIGAPRSLREALRAEGILSKDYETAMQASELARRFPELSAENIAKQEAQLQRNSLKRQLSLMTPKDRKFLRDNIAELLTPEGALRN